MWISEKAVKCIIFLVIQMIQMLQFTCENLAVFSVGFAFLKSDERLDEVGGYLYLEVGENIFL